MSKHPRSQRYAFVLLTASAIFIPSGCGQFGADLLYETTVAPKKLRQIETLELQPAEDEQKEPPDANRPPPPQMSLTLEQARAIALENNLDLKVQLINPAIAAERLTEEEARFEAVFFTNLNYGRTDTPSVSFLDEISGSNVEYLRTDLGVQMPLRTGGAITFDLADQQVETDAEGTRFNPYNTSDLSLSVSQPLLRNAGNRASTYAIQLAQFERQITDARTKLEVIKVIAAIDRVYWRLYAAGRELDVRKKEYELAKTQLEQARRFVRSGERAQVEIVRAEAGVAQRLEAIIIAEKNLRDREREFKRVINKAGLEMQGPTVLTTATLPDPVRYTLDTEKLVKTSLENRMEMLELELQIARDAGTIEYMRNQALPVATLDYTYNINGLGESRRDSFDLLFDKRFEDHRLGLQLQVPLGNQAAKSRLRQALYRRRQRLASREARKAIIEFEVLNAIDQVEANWQRILAGRQRTILDGRLYEAEKRQFEVGLRTTTDVLQAQTTFADAQSAEIVALTEYQIALVDLAYATGTLLGAAKVQWQPITP